MEIQIGKRFRSRLGDIKSLAGNIEEIGLLHPIVVDDAGNLIAGYRRLMAWRALGWSDEDIPMHTVSLKDILRGQVDENIQRLDFSLSEKVAIAESLEAETVKQASNRELAGSKPSVNLTEGLGDSRDILASNVGLSWQTLQKAREIVAAAQGDPDQYGPLVEKMDRTGKVSGIYETFKRRNRAAVLGDAAPPVGIYRTIVVDPPWPELVATGEGDRRKAEKEYPTLSLPEILAKGRDEWVSPIADESCHLYLWVTNSMLPHVFPLVTAWGFTYRNLLTWTKPDFGIGRYFRGATEHIVFATKGDIPLKRDDVPTWFQADKHRHSQKPDEFYRIVESVSYPPFMDINARTPRDGWSVWGNEV